MTSVVTTTKTGASLEPINKSESVLGLIPSLPDVASFSPTLVTRTTFIMDGTPPAPLVSHFAIKLPPFIRSRPDLWFSQAECQFTLGHITSATTKFHHVMSVLPEDVLVEVADILTSPPSDDPYAALKAAVITRASPSDRQRLHELVSNEPLGDRKPSQLLRRLQHILGGPTPLLDRRMLREIFLSKLPPSVQLVLAASDEADLDALSERADKLTELARESDPAACVTTLQKVPSNDPSGACQAAVSISDEGEFASLRQQVRRLADVMEDLRFGTLPPRRSSSPRPAGRLRPRRVNPSTSARSQFPSSPSPPPRGLCWYHSRFGGRARRCEPPCTWQGNILGDH